MLKVNGKNKFSHFVYDMGLRNALAVTLFGIGLVFSLVVPLVCFVMSFIVFLGYCIDKFNLIFVYPLDFDSQITNRKCLIQYAVSCVIAFQTLMLILEQGRLNKNQWYTIVLAIAIQAGLILICLTMLREPWKGLPQKSETAEAVEKEKMFEEISSYHGDFTNANNLIDESLVWQRN